MNPPKNLSDLLMHALVTVPLPLHAAIQRHWETLWSHPNADSLLTGLPWSLSALQRLVRVWAGSEFAARVMSRDPTYVLQRLADPGEAVSSADAYRAMLAPLLAGVTTEAALMTALRRFRQTAMVAIAWRDLANLVTVEQTLADLSYLADALLQAASQWLYDDHCQRFGIPQNHDGQPQPLVVLGLGKLGGHELNYSSDIDVILAYPQAGQTNRRPDLTNEEFFRRLAQRLIKVLHENTADGFVFRVDLRLRPFGESGPLVMQFDALETYYQHHGRDWERYALIKARVVVGSEAGGQLLMRLRPFIYRRYLDYGAIAALRTMKTLIAQEVEKKGLKNNVKLGPGGIREIEFIAQVFQLIYGGRDLALQERSLLPVLSHLAQTKRLPDTAVAALQTAYRFLRTVENRLQAFQDQQTHVLPTDPTAQARLAFSMGVATWDDFMKAYRQHTDQVSAQFRDVIAGGSDQDAYPQEIVALWNGTLSSEQALPLFVAKGFTDPEDSLRRLHAFRHSRAVRLLSPRGRERLDAFMPRLLEALCQKPAHASATLARMIPLLEAIVRRSVYLALLIERPQALQQLLTLCHASPWISRLLTRYPLLLDELLTPAHLYHPIDRSKLAEALQHQLMTVPATDTEQVMDILRHFQQTNLLRVAAADVCDVMPLMVVSDHLTDIAEAVLRAVLDCAWSALTPRFGAPMYRVNGSLQPAHLAIVGYGKLGGIELNYNSDLDVVFIHDSKGREQYTQGNGVIDNQTFFSKVVQRIIHLLTTATSAGVLYDVDMRLRPSGRSGLLVTGLDALADYQRHHAWTWEHQALLRARVVAGPTALAEQFNTLRYEILTQPRDPITLRQEVVAMREKMRDTLGSKNADQFHIKQDRGGIVDIEFLVQYAVLAHAHHYPDLLTYTDNIRQLDGLEKHAIFDAKTALFLRDAYRHLRRYLHHRTLQDQPACLSVAELPEELTEWRHGVMRLWQQWMIAERNTG